MRSILGLRRWRFPLSLLFILAVATVQLSPASAQPAPAQASNAGGASPSVETSPTATSARTAIPAIHRDAARGSRADLQELKTALASSEEPTLGLMTAGVNGTFVQIGSDISSVVSSPSLRIVPLIGKGSLQNISDLLKLRGVDLALVGADAARFAATKNLFPGLGSRVQYIAKLYNEEIHVLAGPNVHSLADLAGKTVNVDVEGSGTYVTSSILFPALNIPVKMTYDSPTVGLLRLQRGEIAASMSVYGKPNRLFKEIPANSGLHLVPIPVDERLMQTYVPSTFSHADYPNLVAEGEVVETLAGPVLLACYAWPADSPKYKSLVTFTSLFFSHLPDLQQPPYQPKWRDVSLSARAPDWTRAPYAQQWLDHNAAGNLAAAAGPPPGTPEEQAFTRWAAGIGLVNLNATQRAQLFSLWQLRQPQLQH